jgi:hypothetical protein
MGCTISEPDEKTPKFWADYIWNQKRKRTAKSLVICDSPSLPRQGVGRKNGQNGLGYKGRTSRQVSKLRG